MEEKRKRVLFYLKENVKTLEQLSEQLALHIKSFGEYWSIKDTIEEEDLDEYDPRWDDGLDYKELSARRDKAREEMRESGRFLDKNKILIVCINVLCLDLKAPTRRGNKTYFPTYNDCGEVDCLVPQCNRTGFPLTYEWKEEVILHFDNKLLDNFNKMKNFTENFIKRVETETLEERLDRFDMFVREFLEASGKVKGIKIELDL